MKCSCGKQIPFWNVEFEIFECNDCRDKKDVRKKMKVLRMAMRKYHGKPLSRQGNALVHMAERFGLLNEYDKRKIAALRNIEGVA